MHEHTKNTEKLEIVSYETFKYCYFLTPLILCDKDIVIPTHYYNYSAFIVPVFDNLIDFLITHFIDQQLDE